MWQNQPFDPTDGDRIIDPESVEIVRSYMAARFPDLADAPIVETRVCQYETTPDSQFIIDRHPDFDNVWIVGGGSGHGFKHGPVIGRYVVERIKGAGVGPAKSVSASTAPERGATTPGPARSPPARGRPSRRS